MKILVVENDKGFRDAWVELLKEFGFNVIQMESLQGNTPKELHSMAFDLALIDRRADRDENPDDITGQLFAIELCALGTPTALITAFLPDEVVLFDLLRTGAVTAIADKRIEKLELAHCIEEFRQSRRFPNCVAQFSWKGKHDPFNEKDWELVAGNVQGLTVSGAEVAVLFRSLIPPCALRVKLEKMTPGHGGAAVFHAMVSSGDGPVVDEVAIKYGERAEIMGEAMRYDRHVGPLPDGVASHLRWRKETKTLGAIAYSWVGDSIEDGIPFGPVKREHDHLTWRRRQSALDRLFSVSLNPWYRVYRSNSAQIKTKIRLLDYYTGDGGYFREVPFADGALPPDLVSPIQNESNTWDFGSYGILPNPIPWLIDGSGSTLELSRYSPCHGDLHVKNIFVLPDDSPRLIDFGDTALGHIFQDFAALEVSIRLSCTTTTNLELLKRAADSASSTKSLGEFIDHRVIDKVEDNLRKTLVTTMQIRRSALDAVGSNSSDGLLKEYLFALIMRLLRYASGIADEVSTEDAVEKQTLLWHALYSAAKATEQALACD